MGRLLGTRKEAALGRRDRDFLPPEIATPLEVADATMISTGRTAMGEHAIGLSGQSPRCYLYSRAPWLGPDGDVLGIITIARDIEFLKQAERELRAADDRKSLLLHDINHRVKNSLASVAGLLELRRLEVDDQDAQNALSASIRQLVVLSHVFDRLHQSTSKESIRIGAFLEDLCDDLRRSVVGGHVMLDASIEDAVLTMDRAIALGLIVNELVANALKYAFPGDRAGKIVVRLQADRPSGLCLVVEDDGVGLSNDRPEGTGRALVGALARQLGGGVEWRQSRGTSALIRFPDAA
jgi:two-component sensor histidine kinase